MINKVALIGTGNIAWHFSEIIIGTGMVISSISSRNYSHAKKLAHLRKSEAIEIKSISEETDLVIIAVNDDAIAEVAGQIPPGDYIVVHTSGSISINVFKDRFRNYGVLYPLQSFLKSKKVDFKKIPMLIEGNSPQVANQLKLFAAKFSDRIEIMDSEQRGKLHLAAVIVNNFVNFLATKSYNYLEKNSIDGSLLHPLMKETIERLETHHPGEMQTGPAKRNDENVIKNQLKQLESYPKLQSLYRLISLQITEEYHGGKL